MRSLTKYWTGLAVFAGLMALLGTGTASAQGLDHQGLGREVSVNPRAGLGGQLLLLPGGGVFRLVPPLLQPGEKPGPIHLHKARPRPVRQASIAPKTPKAEAPKAEAPKPEAPKQVASAAQPQTAGGGAAPPGFAGNLFGGQVMTLHPTPSTGSAPTSPGPAPKAAPATPETKVASASPPPETSVPGLTRRSVILFAKDATEPMASAMEQIRFLAGELNTAMVRESSRIELQAYGGARGDKGSDARRLSLKRALAIRQVLIDDGVSPARIDVRAMGGADSGPADRVDVYVKA